jgi:hypothetical protein
MAAHASAGVIGSLGEAVVRFILSQINVRAEVCSLFCARYTPRRRDRRHRACREGSWEGGGVLLARVTASFLGEGTRRVTMEIAPWCGAIYFIFGRGGSIFTPWGHQTTGFRDVVARAGDTPVQLRRQNPERHLASWQNISHRGQFRRRWCLNW